MTKEVINMFCPHCGYSCEDSDRYCSHCGAPLTRQVQVRKGSHWVPLLILLVIFSFGLGLFFALPGRDSEFPEVPEEAVEYSWFSVDNGVLYFDATRYNGTDKLIIPDELFGQTVIGIGEGCFENCTNLTAIILPNGLQAIGEDAFRGCTSLRGIQLPETVAIIGKGAFSGCSSLEAFCGYDGIRSIGAGAFSGCSKLFYIYFVGYYEDWTELYPEYINPYTTVFCEDGSFYQGGTPY